MIEDYLFDGGRPQELRLQLVSSTQTLLGDTIGLSDDEWQAPSRLPGWTRAHLASHLAQEANRVLAVSERLQRGVRPLSWAISEPDRELEAASRRSAVALQVALDTSASQLLTSLDQLSDDSWNTRLNTPLGPLPAAVLVLARLNEVALHHVDLDLGRKLSDLDPALTALLLTWNARRLSPRLRHYRLHLMADEGVDLTLGDGDWTAEVRGSQASLLGWITGRRDSTAVLGAEAIDLGGPV